MSAPKRAAKTTSTKSTQSKKAAKKAPAKSGVKKTTGAPTKTKTKPSAKTAVKTTADKKTPSVAQTIAKKVAKIISKVVAKKKTIAKKPADTTRPAAKPKAKVTAKKSVKKAAKKIAAKAAPKNTGEKSKLKTVPRKRPKAFAQREAQRAYGFPVDAPELPENYGEDRLVLMTKDPEYLFAYWEITPEKKTEGEKVKHSGEEYLEALRLNWSARDIFERNFVVLPVNLDARKWYVRVPFSGLAYQIEIGWLSESGHFISLLTSNPSDAPESWNATRRRLKNTLIKGGILEHTLAVGRPQGSSDLAPSLAQTAPLAGDWNFPGPGTLVSSPGLTKKPARPSTR